MKLVIILSVEGIESNTEINFYQGLSYYLPNNKIKLKVFAIGKCKNSQQRENNLQHLLQMIFGELDNVLQSSLKVKIFFVGDLNIEENIPSMKNSIKITQKYVNDFKKYFSNIEFQIEENIIGDNGRSFEYFLDILKPKEKLIYKKYKTFVDAKQATTKKNNTTFFNETCRVLDWLDSEIETKINYDKILNETKEIPTKHYLIFKELFS